MMKKMGYENDKGLGKSNQGRLEPVIAVQQDGRRGFGLKLDTVQFSAGQWDPACEELEIPEPVLWLHNPGGGADSYSLDQLMGHVVTGPKKLTLDEETRYCDPATLHHILNAKTVFDDLNDSEKRRARSRCNPFETIRSSIFLNRAAVKMANIDSMCDFMFTNPRDLDGQSLVAADELLYFTDMCAGEVSGRGKTISGNPRKPSFTFACLISLTSREINHKPKMWYTNLSNLFILHKQSVSVW